MTGDQEFLVTDVLRLEVQQGWPDLPNDVLNPSGEGGAWGWIVTDESADPTPGISDYVHLWGLTDRFEFAVTDDLEPGTQAAALYAITIAQVEAAGQSFRASVDVQSVGGMPPNGTFGVRLLSDDDTNDFAFPDPLTVGVNELPTTAIPIGTHTIQFFYLTPADAEAGHLIRFRDVVVVHGATADVAASDPLSEPPWTDILGSAASIEIDRGDLQVGILTAKLYDSSLDPASTDLVWPGKRCRVQALVDGTWESLFDGKLNAPSSAYEVRDPTLPDEKRVEISLSGSDIAGPLTSTPRAEGVGTLDELPYVLLGTHTPFNINGSSVALDPAMVTVEGYSDQASALDQISMTRDSVLGYVWFDRKGVLRAWYRQDMEDVVLLNLDESDYSDLDVDWDVELTFNTVEIEQLRRDGTSWTWGPYVDELAKRQWNERKATFRVLGVADDDIPLYAQTVLGLNSTPVKRINSVTLPVRTIAELESRALLDLYDLVSVSNDQAEIADQQSRVVGVKHRITIKREGSRLVNRWWVDLQFTGQQTGGGAATARAAVPQATPPQVPSFARIRSMLSGAGRVKPTDFGAVGDGETDDSAALVDCWEALGEAADVAQFRGTLEVDRPYLFNVAVKQFGGYTVMQSTPRRLPAAGVIDYLEPGLIAAGDEAQYLFGQTGDGSGSLNDNPGMIYGLCVDGAGIAGAEGLFYADAAQSSVYDLMVMGVVDDGVALAVGRSQNLNFFNPQIGQNNGIGVQLKAKPGQQGPGHNVFFGGHIHDNTIGVVIAGTAGDFFPPHDNLFKGTLIESGRIAGQPIQIAVQAHAGLGTVLEDVNITYGAQVGGGTGNDVSDDCSVLINNTQFPGYSTTLIVRGGTIGGGINKVTDAIRIRQDVAGAANKLVLENVGFANVDNMICVDGEHGSDPDFADPIVDISSVYKITGVGAFSRAINNGTRLNHGHETPLGTRYELPTGLANGQIQNPIVIKHEDEGFSRLSIDWNGLIRFHDPATGNAVGSLARNGAVWGTGGPFVIGGSFGFSPSSTNIGANTAVTIDSSLTARHELTFTVGGVNVTALAISNGVTGRKLMLSILGSGGANAITWPASSVIQFRTTAPQPIAGVRQYVELEYVGTKWFEVSRSG